MITEELENYTPKGDLEGFPKEIIARMLECQEEQGNPRDISIFEKIIVAGFTWSFTKEGSYFWNEVINYKDFDIFFERYPKQNNQDNSQEFKVGDKVIDILTGQRGKIIEINTNDDNPLPIYVSFSKGKEPYTLDGRYYPEDKYPRLIHYRVDYDYSIINFNNLPKRQEPKRWRAKKDGVYYFVNFFTKDWFFSDETKDDYDPIDNENYNSGNYFRTEIEGEIIAQKLNTYLKQLIKEEHEREIKKQL